MVVSAMLLMFVPLLCEKSSSLNQHRHRNLKLRVSWSCEFSHMCCQCRHQTFGVLPGLEDDPNIRVEFCWVEVLPHTPHKKSGGIGPFSPPYLTSRISYAKLIYQPKIPIGRWGLRVFRCGSTGCHQLLYTFIIQAKGVAGKSHLVHGWRCGIHKLWEIITMDSLYNGYIYI